MTKQAIKSVNSATQQVLPTMQPITSKQGANKIVRKSAAAGSRVAVENITFQLTKRTLNQDGSGPFIDCEDVDIGICRRGMLELVKTSSQSCSMIS